MSRQIKDIVITTIDSYHEECNILGLVHATIVVSKSVVGDFIANMKNWSVGGELPGYASMIDQAVHKAQWHLKKQALGMNADAVIGFRICSTEVSEGAAEIIAYGTAVQEKKLKQTETNQ